MNAHPQAVHQFSAVDVDGRAFDLQLRVIEGVTALARLGINGVYGPWSRIDMTTAVEAEIRRVAGQVGQ